jgi:hypothetical protein
MLLRALYPRPRSEDRPHGTRLNRPLAEAPEKPALFGSQGSYGH